MLAAERGFRAAWVFRHHHGVVRPSVPDVGYGPTAVIQCNVGGIPGNRWNTLHRDGSRIPSLSNGEMVAFDCRWSRIDHLRGVYCPMAGASRNDFRICHCGDRLDGEWSVSFGCCLFSPSEQNGFATKWTIWEIAEEDHIENIAASEVGDQKRF